MENLSGITVVLPTLNEEENIKSLIPGIVNVMDKNNIVNYEILVVDDNSQDNTNELIRLMNISNPKINIYQREGLRSLPMSIWDGIDNSRYEYVMWLDADGSMTPDAVEKLIVKLNEDNEKIIVGSRFVEFGGYKGVRDIGKDSIFDAIKNVSKSNDSVFGMIFSIFFNKFLKYIFVGNVSDITSGFIVGNKKNFNKESFEKADYGEYFIYLCVDILKNKKEIIEVGYICETRVYGTSKTASNLIQLIKRGVPYIQAALNSRKENNENS